MTERLERQIPDADAAIKEIRNILGGSLPSRSLFEPYHPQKDWYVRQGEMGGIHGVNHETRVMIAAEILSRIQEKMSGVRLNRVALRLAAATHDVRRLDDGYDLSHGFRAADWMQDYFRDQFDPETLDTATYVTRWHVTPDPRIPQITPELAIFKDADALDRARLGDLDVRFLRHGHARTLLVQPIDTLCRISSHKQWYKQGKLFDCVLDTAIEIGLINP